MPHSEVIPPPSVAIEPDRVGPERAMLIEFLDSFRTVLLRKAAGLDRAQLATRVGSSSLTLAGMLKHMALVEQQWFRECWLGETPNEPWASVDWKAQPDWEFDTAVDDEPRALADLYLAAIERSRTAIDDSHDLDATVRYRDQSWSLRWILVHMIEEYARHCGHADLIRESIDGTTGD